jgi:hypothetical protein
MLKNKILKIKTNDIENKQLKETLYLNSLKVSQTVPNSENDSAPSNSNSGNSNSDKANLCNIGSKTDSKSISALNENNSSNSKNSQSQSSSMFKTINDKNHLDAYLHVSI